LPLPGSPRSTINTFGRPAVISASDRGGASGCFVFGGFFFFASVQLLPPPGLAFFATSLSSLPFIAASKMLTDNFARHFTKTCRLFRRVCLRGLFV
jgi:hypothetical protein